MSTRGQRLPRNLMGAYLYADYITNFMRALRYDENHGTRGSQSADSRPQTSSAILRRRRNG